ncbi:4-dihydromethyltrisporate dehydrogenase [Radiomyces spectabilis]|uniref:4-dihydromethyltrisporate dehydrogenase n=1 Tax=Radiomyces spectabilis TaxID=64574 RepID=UPI00221E4600|nr:4-dihydromethyltrisporate dehydrogenase [Radiomyces spectabilis]KAI8393483.1 4-dihydromethyltrisporate dehydrogenase [Radiomyces spectabilis]
MTNQDYVQLNRTGDKMPLVGFGCWKVSKDDVENTIYAAVKAGYRLFDGACDYGNEAEVGRGLKKAIQDGLVKRQELFVVSKLWNTFHSKDHVRSAAEKQLKDWNLEYFDLYLVHFPVPLKYVDPKDKYPPSWYQPNNEDSLEFERSPMHETWREMEKLVDDGLARNIGISNFNVQSVLDLLSYCRIKPATLQVEIHPYLPQKRLVEWVQSQGIQVTAYSSFGPGSYSGMSEAGKTTQPLLSHDKIKAIADKYKVSTGQVLLRWAIERGIAVIPKSEHEERLKSNRDVFSWSLDKEDQKEIDSLSCGLRFNNPDDMGLGLPLFA